MGNIDFLFATNSRIFANHYIKPLVLTNGFFVLKNMALAKMLVV